MRREIWIFQVTKIPISKNTRIYYENKNTIIQRLVVEFTFIWNINFVKWIELLYKIHTEFNITKTRIYHNNILKISIIKYTFYLMNIVYKKMLYWQHNKIIYYWTYKVPKSFTLFNLESLLIYYFIIIIINENLLSRNILNVCLHELWKIQDMKSYLIYKL